jgi:hypothetical protein
MVADVSEWLGGAGVLGGAEFGVDIDWDMAIGRMAAED